MELKQWLGLAGAGLAMLVASAILNDPKNIFAQEGISPPALEGVPTGAPATASKTLPTVARPERKPTKEIVAEPVATKPEKPAAKKAQPQPAARTEKVVTKKAAARPSPKVEKKPAPRSEPKPAPARTATKAVAGPKGRFIRGVVNYIGKKKSNPKIDMSSDAVCVSLANGQQVYKENYIIKDGKLANVVVYLASKKLPKDGKAHKEQIEIDQEGCRYKPHAVAVQIGQPVVIKNSDPTTHNVHFVSRKNGDWNKSQPTQGEVMGLVQPLKRPEVGTASLKCDIHPWMEAKVYIFDHPYYALTGEDGTFSIDCTGLPDGEYVLMAYHEKFKTKYQEGDKKGRIKVKLGADGADVTINFTGKKKKKRK